MESIECQMIEGGTGDFILVKGKNQPTMTARAERFRGEYYYYPKGEPMKFPPGRINWFDRDPHWKDVKGFRGRYDLEMPVGEWNTLECICDGDKITNILNGTVVNAGTNASHTKGKILFQSNVSCATAASTRSLKDRAKSCACSSPERPSILISK